MNNNLVFRFPDLQDTKPTFDMLSQCDIHEFGEANSSMEDLLNDWNNINLKEDAWLLLTPEQKVIGYAAVIPWMTGYKYDLYVHPTVSDKEIIHALLTRCEERSARLVKEQQKTAGTQARCYVAQVNQQASSVLEERGFQKIKYIYNMQARFDAPPPPIQLPDSISIRNPIPGQDAQAIYEVIQSAFEGPGRTRSSFEDWKKFMLREDIFKPELWFLAMRGEKMVGVCLCYQYSGSDQGWIRQLGVLESVRRTGLGSALLHHAFSEFYKRGFMNVGLAVRVRESTGDPLL